MTVKEKVRNWMKISTRPIAISKPFQFRNVCLDNAKRLGTLMEVSYQGTIDHEGETLWKEKPLLAFSMTAPSAQRKGYGTFLIERSIDALSKSGYLEFSLAVTEGNPAEQVYRRLGFSLIGPTLSKT
jgi:GNAT superfamily N-acetyltransferase